MDEEALSEGERLGVSRQQMIESVMGKHHNNASTTYHLLIKKFTKQRNAKRCGLHMCLCLCLDLHTQGGLNWHRLYLCACAWLCVCSQSEALKSAESSSAKAHTPNAAAPSKGNGSAAATAKGGAQSTKGNTAAKGVNVGANGNPAVRVGRPKVPKLNVTNMSAHTNTHVSQSARVRMNAKELKQKFATQSHIQSRRPHPKSARAQLNVKPYAARPHAAASNGSAQRTHAHPIAAKPPSQGSRQRPNAPVRANVVSRGSAQSHSVGVRRVVAPSMANRRIVQNSNASAIANGAGKGVQVPVSERLSSRSSNSRPNSRAASQQRTPSTLSQYSGAAT